MCQRGGPHAGHGRRHARRSPRDGVPAQRGRARRSAQARPLHRPGRADRRQHRGADRGADRPTLDQADRHGEHPARSHEPHQRVSTGTTAFDVHRGHRGIRGRGHHARAGRADGQRDQVLQAVRGRPRPCRTAVVGRGHHRGGRGDRHEAAGARTCRTRRVDHRAARPRRPVRYPPRPGRRGVPGPETPVTGAVPSFTARRCQRGAAHPGRPRHPAPSRGRTHRAQPSSGRDRLAALDAARVAVVGRPVEEAAARSDTREFPRPQPIEDCP